MLHYEDKFEELEISLDISKAIYWLNFQPKFRPCFTPSLLTDIQKAFNSIRNLCSTDSENPPIKWLVIGSTIPGIYNYGGDLELFINHIRKQNREGLQAYAHQCIELVYNLSTGANLPMNKIALLEGDALGGGFEAALACDFIIAEKQVNIGLPESTFNLFPGMGAYSFLSRRIGSQKAKAMIFSGQIYKATELWEWGVIDMVVEEGTGKQATLEFIEGRQKYYNSYQAMKQVSNVVQPVSKSELMTIVEIWIDATLNLDLANVRKMEKLVSSQLRKWGKIHKL
ncbi:crotonase/enoyl-CoA hydratase family protein [Nodularia chucula]|uniref:crotonase/enoyl-CoA hydratase family protein n=1 Tax=Nodularia chucula TaxID=3093667 RepID=UPI0039C5B094